MGNYLEQERATRALIKFCLDHGYNSKDVETVQRCLSALEEGKPELAIREFHAVALGGMGCFNDWWPPVVYQHETEEYVWAVFEGLITQWGIIMNLFEKFQEKDLPSKQ